MAYAHHSLLCSMKEELFCSMRQFKVLIEAWIREPRETGELFISMARGRVTFCCPPFLATACVDIFGSRLALLLSSVVDVGRLSAGAVGLSRSFLHDFPSFLQDRELTGQGRLVSGMLD
jgi:hypothetical protein